MDNFHNRLNLDQGMSSTMARKGILKLVKL